MSKAFTKEDDEIPEVLAGRRRSSSGLPPGAVNYMTAGGARLLQDLLARAKGRGTEELRAILAAATIISPQEETPEEALFGVAVTIRRESGDEETFRIVGADEAGLRPGWVSWVSPLGRALTGGKVGARVYLPDVPPTEVVRVLRLAW